MRIRLLSVALLLALLSVSLASRGRTGEPAIVPDALHARAAAKGPVRVIVRLNAPYLPEGQLASPAHVLGQRQLLAGVQATVRGHLRGVHHRVVREFGGRLPLMAIEASPDALQMLASLRGVVVDVQEDKLSAPSLAQSVPLINADDAWALGYDGTNQIVAILDTGVQKDHSFFAANGGKVIAEACFSSNSSGGTSVCPGGIENAFGAGTGLPCALSECDHGTHVAGIAAGAGASFSGVAKGAQIIAIQVFSQFASEDDCGVGQAPCVLSFSSDQIEALNYVHAQRQIFPGRRIAAVNMSLGGSGFFSTCDSAPQKLAIDQLRTPDPTDPTDPGVATVIAAGNSFFTDAISTPGCISTAIPVASSTKSDVISSFSNIAAPALFPNLLVAPGSSIMSSVPPGPDTFAIFNGTSMAAPHVAGTFAILRQVAPTATVSALTDKLKASGKPIHDGRPVCANGCRTTGATAPRIDVLAAIAQLTPNLVVQTLTAPTAAVPGANISATTSIRNTNVGPAGASNLKLYLATDAVVTMGDQLLATVAFAPLNGGAVSPVKTQGVQIPIATGPGSYFIRAVADADGAPGDETNETDNTKVVPIQVVLPDLSVPSVTFAPAATGPGANISVTHTLHNLAASPATAPASTSGIYLGVNQSLGSAVGGRLATVAAPAVAGGATSPPVTATSVNVPGGMPVGRYYVLVQANDTAAFTEGVAGSNVGASTTTLLVGPDLVVTAASTGTGISPGGNLSVTYTLKNQGGQGAGGFGVAFTLVPQAGGPGLPIGPGRNVSSLSAAATTSFTNVLAIPADTPPGPYKVLVTADATNAVAEADEGNNTRLTGVVNVVRADLAVQSVTFTPAATLPGGNVTLTHVVKNVAPAPSVATGSFSRLRLTLGQNLSTVADFGLVPVPALPAGLLATLTTPVQIPANTSVGLYYLSAFADDPGTVFELDESLASNLRFSLTRLIVGPDVLPTAASTAVAAVVPGTNLSVMYTLKNQGGQATDLNVTFALVAQPSGTITPIGPDNVVTGFAAGATKSYTSAVSIPAGVAPGAYKIRVLVDPASDADPTNNALLTGVVNLVRADLKVPSVTFTPAASFPGGNVTVTHTVKNVGPPPGNAAATSTLLQLGTNQSAGIADLGLVTVPSIPAGATVTVPKIVPIPLGTAPGLYYVLANADALGTLVELNDDPSDNRGASQTRIIIGPDLLPTAATVPASAGTGANVSVAYTLKNQGGQAASNFSVGFALVPVNASGVATGADLPLGTVRVVVTLAAGATQALTDAVTIPADTTGGLYRIRVLADSTNVVTEADETNNTRLTTGTLSVIPPNLTVPAPTFSPAASQPNGAYTVLYSVKNVAPTPANAGPSFSRLFLSVNQSASGQVADLGTVPVPAIMAGTAVPGTRVGTLPGNLPPGLYYFGIEADPVSMGSPRGAVLESNEADNFGFTQTRLIVGPDLLPTAATTATASTLGANVSVAYTLKNQGGQAASNFSVAFALVPVNAGGVATGPDIPLGTVRLVVTLGAGATQALVDAVTIPADTTGGLYRIRVLADSTNVVAEADETNNTLLTAGTLSVVRPDLKVMSVGATPAVAAVGTNLSVTQVVKNIAAAPGTAGPTTARFYLLPGAVLPSSSGGAAPLTLGTSVDAPVPALPGGAMATVSSTLSVPNIPPGKYFITAQANALSTILEADSPLQANDFLTMTTPIVVGPDLAIAAATATPAAIAPGANVSVANTVKNQGGAAAGPFDVGFYLSTSNVFDGSAVLLTTRRLTGLAPGATSPATTPVTIPSNQSAGTYYVIVRADSAVMEEVTEADETNNTRATAAITVVRPDLAVLSVTATPGATAPGASLSVTHTIKNLASAVGGAPSTVSRLYLSNTSSPVNLTSQTVLGDVTVPALAGVMTTSVTASVPVPPGTVPGKYWVFASANAVAPILEAATGNNVAVTTNPILIGPDLVMTTLTVPFATSPHLTIPVTTTVKNQGGQGTNGSVVRFFLSLSGVLDGSEVPIGVTNTAALAPSASFTTTSRITIPGNTVPGAKFLLTQIDSGIAEADLANNIRLQSFNIFPPNLQIVSITTPAAVIRGRVTGAPNVSVVVKNIADPNISGVSPPFDVQVFANRDDGTMNAQVPGSGDLLFSKTVAALAPGATTTVTGPLVIPETVGPDVRLAGNYFVSATADPTGAATADTSLGDNVLTLTAKPLPVLPDLTVLHSATAALDLQPACSVPGSHLDLQGPIHITSQSIANPSSFAGSVTLDDPGVGFHVVYSISGTVRALVGATAGAIASTFTYSGGGTSGTGTINGAAPGLDFTGGVVTGQQTGLPACTFTGTINIVRTP
jgi:subtilase family serine protease